MFRLLPALRKQNNSDNGVVMSGSPIPKLVSDLSLIISTVSHTSATAWFLFNCTEFSCEGLKKYNSSYNKWSDSDNIKYY